MTFLSKPVAYDNRLLAGYYISPKVFGTHVFWDGGISRDCMVKDVPYSKGTGMATGFWDSNRVRVSASNAFLNKLPCMPLEGVLNKDGFAVFSCPPLGSICPGIENWLATRPESLLESLQFLPVEVPGISFERELAVLRVSIPADGDVYLCRHVRLPLDEEVAHFIAVRNLFHGPLILRDPRSCWPSGLFNFESC